MGLHFQPEGHSVNDVRVQVVELISTGPDRKRRVNRAESFFESGSLDETPADPHPDRWPQH